MFSSQWGGADNNQELQLSANDYRVNPNSSDIYFIGNCSPNQFNTQGEVYSPNVQDIDALMDEYNNRLSRGDVSPLFYEHKTGRSPIGEVLMLYRNGQDDLCCLGHISGSTYEGKQVISNMVEGEMQGLSAGLGTAIRNDTSKSWIPYKVPTSRRLNEVSVTADPCYADRTWIKYYSDDPSCMLEKIAGLVNDNTTDPSRTIKRLPSQLQDLPSIMNKKQSQGKKFSLQGQRANFAGGNKNGGSSDASMMAHFFSHVASQKRAPSDLTSFFAVDPTTRTPGQPGTQKRASTRIVDTRRSKEHPVYIGLPASCRDQYIPDTGDDNTTTTTEQTTSNMALPLLPELGGTTKFEKPTHTVNTTASAATAQASQQPEQQPPLNPLSQVLERADQANILEQTLSGLKGTFVGSGGAPAAQSQSQPQQPQAPNATAPPQQPATQTPNITTQPQAPVPPAQPTTPPAVAAAPQTTAPNPPVAQTTPAAAPAAQPQVPVNPPPQFNYVPQGTGAAVPATGASVPPTPTNRPDLSNVSKEATLATMSEIGAEKLARMTGTMGFLEKQGLGNDEALLKHLTETERMKSELEAFRKEKADREQQAKAAEEKRARDERSNEKMRQINLMLQPIVNVLKTGKVPLTDEQKQALDVLSNIKSHPDIEITDKHLSLSADVVTTANKFIADQQGHEQFAKQQNAMSMASAYQGDMMENRYREMLGQQQQSSYRQQQQPQYSAPTQSSYSPPPTQHQSSERERMDVDPSQNQAYQPPAPQSSSGAYGTGDSKSFVLDVNEMVTQASRVHAHSVANGDDFQTAFLKRITQPAIRNMDLTNYQSFLRTDLRFPERNNPMNFVLTNYDTGL